MKQRLFSLLLCGVMLFSLCPSVSAAEDQTMPLAEGNVAYLDRHWDETTKQVVTENKTVSNPTTVTNSNTWSNGWYVVNSNVTVNSRITVTGDVHLILEDGCTLTANYGISVENTNSLTIYVQEQETGKLIAKTNPYNDAAIGGKFHRPEDANKCCGSITINGGQIEATGANNAAGIGSGLSHSGGNITINGGKVTAKGGKWAAGIGSSPDNKTGKSITSITINGGTVIATGNITGAGIGGGEGKAGSDTSITINGGNITATGGENGGAGIGGGAGSEAGSAAGAGGTITITGGTINATSGGNGAGIGGGGSAVGGTAGAGGTITITGGTVNATSGGSGAGIGSGVNKDGSEGDSGRFSTGTNGNAFITASSISDNDDRTAWGGVIFEGNDGKVYGGTITLTTNAEIHSGKTLTIDDGQTLIIGTGKTLTNNGTIKGNGTITGTLSGNKAIPSVTPPDNLTATYGQTLNDVTLPTGWTWDALTTPVGNVGSNSFPATYTKDNSGNYSEVKQNLTVHVGKATPSVTVPTAAQNLTYNGSAQALISAGSTTGGELQYSIDGTAYSTEIPTGINIGSYTVYYKVVGNGNYSDVAAQSISITIAKATPTADLFTFTAPSDLTYSGKAKPVAVTANSGVTGMGAVTVRYFDKEGRVVDQLPVNAGTYTVKINVAEGSNYTAATDLTSGSWTFTVTKAPAPASVEKPLNIANALAKTYEFAFSNLRPEISGSWVNVSYAIAVNFTAEGYYNGDATIVKGPSGVMNILSLPIQFNEATTTGDVGTVMVTVKSDNYEDYTGTIKIMASNKTAVNFRGVEGVTVPYTGQPVTGYTGTLEVTDTEGNTVELTPEISYTGRLATSYENTQPPTAVGTYFVVFRAADTDPAYIGRQAIPFEITKATPTGEPNYTAITTGGKTLADAELTVEGDTFSVPGTVAWELDETTAVEANTAYKWVFTPTDTANYNTLEGSITLWQRSNSSSSSSTPPTYKPDVTPPSKGGDVPTTSPSNPKRGDTVTVTPKPDEGYKVDKITVTDRNGKPVEVVAKPDGTYTFRQPSGKVTIKVTYVPLSDLPGDIWNNPFTDVSEGDWYYEAVRFVQDRGLMNGYSDGRFGPNDQLSRAQLAQILFNKEGGPVVNYLLEFSDVSGEAWYTEAIRWAASQGIVGGYGDGTFGPNDPITREQLAVMLWRYSGSPSATEKELHFTDTDAISGYALEAMQWAAENGILNGYGDGRLGPQGQATRAQAAQMLKNFMEDQKGGI